MGESTPTAQVEIPHESVCDRFGVVHTLDPGTPKYGNASYGNLSRPAYACGCRPLIHRFKCAACHRLCGWCFGCASDYAWENECCDDCVVAIWRSAERLGIDREDLGAQLDSDDEFRRNVYAHAAALFGGPS